MKINCLVAAFMFLIILTGCRLKCGFLASSTCNEKYYWGYVPQFDGRWAWVICKAKKNFSKIPDYAFVQFVFNDDGTMKAIKGGLDPAGIGPFDQRPSPNGMAHENVQCGYIACRVQLIKVGTLKAVKDNPKAFNFATYYTPYEMFARQLELDYADVQTESNKYGCPETYNCLPPPFNGNVMDRMYNLCGLSNFREEPDGRPGVQLTDDITGGGTITADCYTKSKGIFDANKVNNYLQSPPKDAKIFPVYLQDSKLEKDFSATSRDIYLDFSKDINKRNSTRYVYGYAEIKNWEWNDTITNSGTYFSVKLKTPTGGFYDNEINLRTCKNFGHYTETESKICRNVLNAFTYSDGTVAYAFRLPIEQLGSHSLQLVKMERDKMPDIFGEYQFNSFRSNTIAYNQGTSNEVEYTSQSRDLSLTLLQFPQPSIPNLKDCKLDAFNTLEETLEDAYSLSEKDNPLNTETSIEKGIDFKLTNCMVEGEMAKRLSYIIDENLILKVDVKNIRANLKNTIDNDYKTAFYHEMSFKANTLAMIYANACPSLMDEMKPDDAMKTVATMVQEMRYVGVKGEVLEIEGSTEHIMTGINKGLEIAVSERNSLKSPYQLTNLLAGSLPNIKKVYGYKNGRVSFLFYRYIKEYLKEVNKLESITMENLCSIVLAHEVGHLWSQHYMIREGLPDAEAHHEYCTGKNVCDCIWRYDNQTNEWANRINKNGAKFCESHRQIILNQLLRKF